MQIRTLQPHEAPLFREIRLHALADSPNAFAETLQQAQTQPQVYWERLTHSLSQPNSHVMFLAEQAGRVVGFAFGLVDRQDSKIGHLGGMWVDPTCRGHGVGSALIAEILTWAQQRNQTQLELWVTEGNVKAMGLYRKVGFVDTGKRDVLPSNPSLPTIQMSLRIFTSVT
ncbi:MAG: GNAT family N-acetyltransferase [Oscillatoriophycideae cyanobacterium NC_groundwater_1537_Pr4_S-0.65um_50_18]|nr:GNAT family N-acetyltransferase [Oscillatoriophycideae cyanobacterium NC_groundwater_1537_Pr4_S-0.65um_50_18]